jgi:hypothetical protein
MAASVDLFAEIAGKVYAPGTDTNNDFIIGYAELLNDISPVLLKTISRIVCSNWYSQ